MVFRFISYKPYVECARSVHLVFFFSSRRRHTIFKCDWSSDVCSSDLRPESLLSPALASLRAIAYKTPTLTRRATGRPTLLMQPAFPFIIRFVGSLRATLLTLRPIGFLDPCPCLKCMRGQHRHARHGMLQ